MRAERGVEIALTPEARGALAAICLADLSNGGRGVRNQVEAHFVNPLARAVFALEPQPGERILVEQIAQVAGLTSLKVVRSNPANRAA